MQRGAIRATVGGVSFDIPLGTFSAGQFLRYNATGGPGSTPIIDSAAGGGGGGDFVGPGASVDNHLVLFSGTTGKLGKDSAPVVVDAAGNISGLGTVTSGNVNGVNVAAHAARHNPAGADAMFTGTWAADDEPMWNGTIWVAKQRSYGFNNATQASSATALADITGHASFALKSGFTYYFRFTGSYITVLTTIGLRMSANYSGTSSSYTATMLTGCVTPAAGVSAQTTLNTAMGSGTGPGPTTTELVEFFGRIVTTSAGTFAFRIASETAANAVTLQAGGLSEVWQA